MKEIQYKKWKKAMHMGFVLFHCHQLPERSFFIRGMQFPLCARCTGILLGFVLLGPLITIFTFGNMYISIALILLLCVDGFLQLWKILQSNNIRRLITGLGFGYACFSIIVHIIVKIIFIIN